MLLEFRLFLWCPPVKPWYFVFSMSRKFHPFSTTDCFDPPEFYVSSRRFSQRFRNSVISNVVSLGYFPELTCFIWSETRLRKFLFSNTLKNVNSNFNHFQNSSQTTFSNILKKIQFLHSEKNTYNFHILKKIHTIFNTLKKIHTIFKHSEKYKFQFLPLPKLSKQTPIPTTSRKPKKTHQNLPHHTFFFLFQSIRRSHSPQPNAFLPLWLGECWGGFMLRQSIIFGQVDYFLSTECRGQPVVFSSLWFRLAPLLFDF